MTIAVPAQATPSQDADPLEAARLLAKGLSRAEKRALRLACELAAKGPHPDRPTASSYFSKESTLSSLRDKGLLIWSAHRGSTYHLTPTAVLVGQHLLNNGAAA